MHSPSEKRTWDLFCRVIDNHGDIGVCWRLAADLGARGERVRLWVDDPAALAWMAPRGAPGVTLHPFDGAGRVEEAPGDVVIEAFGCDLPQAFVRRMATARSAPLWINLEYLSAESYVERSHRLPSPQLSGPGAELDKWFFYPGFTARTGGLIREPGLAQQQRSFDAQAWLAAHAVPRQERAHERVVSLFCYAQPALGGLLEHFARQPTLLLATPGPATRQLLEQTGPALQRGALRAHRLPLLAQTDYDRLLWACDLNFVRGEDSFVRAQWAGAPFVWQVYPQEDGAHAVKLGAFLDRFLEDAEPVFAADVRAIHAAWNGLATSGWKMPDAAIWRAHCEGWREKLLSQADLSSQLLGFVARKR
ncbi:MAG: elongation factor P maturation arginine rhamnosyltransferase EarP [Burkholderiaceae bacterium]